MQKHFYITIAPQPLLNTASTLLCVGSCFAQEMVKHTRVKGIKAYGNPLGTLYNSESILELFKLLVSDGDYTTAELFCENGLYFGRQHASEFADISPRVVVDKINKVVAKYRRVLKKTKAVVITYGTSVVYRYKGVVLANCHALPPELFVKDYLTVQNNIDNIMNTILLIKKYCGDIPVFTTLSPVRHTPTDAVNNSLSKAYVRAALGEVEHRKLSQVFYFPAYEIVLDEMRDYLHFKADGVHPKTAVAQDIVDRFLRGYFTNAALDKMQKLQQVQKNIEHRAKQPYSLKYFELLVCCASNIAQFEECGLYVLPWKIKISCFLVEFFYEHAQTNAIIDKLFSKQNKWHVFFTQAILILQNKHKNYKSIIEFTTKVKAIQEVQTLILRRVARDLSSSEAL